MMMQTLLLICTLATPQVACGLETAEAVIQGPEAMSLVECGLHGQAYIAGGALAEYLDGEHYLKVSCTSGRRVRAAWPHPVQSIGQGPRTVQTTD